MRCHRSNSRCTNWPTPAIASSRSSPIGSSAACRARSPRERRRCTARWTMHERESVRRLFEQLVVVGADAEPTRRRPPRADLAGSPTDAAMDALIDRWTQARLLTGDRDPQTRVPTVEVAHEALIREWPRLRAWIDEDRDELMVLGHLRESAASWVEVDRDPGALYRGARLQAALDVSERRASHLPDRRGVPRHSRDARDREQQRADESTSGAVEPPAAHPARGDRDRARRRAGGRVHRPRPAPPSRPRATCRDGARAGGGGRCQPDGGSAAEHAARLEGGRHEPAPRHGADRGNRCAPRGSHDIADRARLPRPRRQPRLEPRRHRIRHGGARRLGNHRHPRRRDGRVGPRLPRSRRRRQRRGVRLGRTDAGHDRRRRRPARLGLLERQSRGRLRLPRWRPGVVAGDQPRRLEGGRLLARPGRRAGVRHRLRQAGRRDRRHSRVRRLVQPRRLADRVRQRLGTSCDHRRRRHRSRR